MGDTVHEQASPGNDVAIVLVHGFLSSAKTWSPFTRLIEADPDLAGLRLHGFEYATNLFSIRPSRRIPSLNNVADSLRTFLLTEVGDAADLVMVSHSQGGLVVQRYLARMLAEGRGRDLARIRRIVMFACPNAGSQLALLARRTFLGGRNPQEEALRPLDEAVADTQRTVLNQIVHANAVAPDRCPIPIVAYAGEADGVVTPASARGVFPDVGVLPGDHSSIIRPESRTHRSFTALRRDLLIALATPSPQGGPQDGPGGGPQDGPGGGGRPPGQRVAEDPPTEPPAPPDLGAGGSGPPPEVDLAPWNRRIVDGLLRVPGMTDPGFRAQLYELLPPVIVNSLRRSGTARLELFALVGSFGHFGQLDPWGKLAAALADLAPEQQPVRELISLLAEAGLVPGEPGLR